MSTYIVDIDGTIANGEHRVHLAKEKKWDEYFDLCHLDTPIWQMQALLADLGTNDHNEIVYFSGRAERIRGKTVMWMHEHNFPKGPLYMRSDGDHRPDHIVKKEMYLKYLEDAANEQPVLVFDDRDQVVKMWRELGLVCAQVAYGDF